MESLPGAQWEKQATWGKSLFFYIEQTSGAMLKAAYWFVPRLKAMQWCKWKCVKSLYWFFFFFFFSFFLKQGHPPWEILLAILLGLSVSEVRPFSTRLCMSFFYWGNVDSMLRAAMLTKFPFWRKLLGEEKEMVKRSAVTENKFAGPSLQSSTRRVNPILKKSLLVTQ